jgi:hypothetical protein
MSSAIMNSKFDDALDRSCLLELAESSGAAAKSAVDGGLHGDEGLAASLVSMSNHLYALAAWLTLTTAPLPTYGTRS